MTDNEIIKALEYCVHHKECNDGCPCIISEKPCVVNDPATLFDLINRQKAEIEKLKSENFALSQKRITMFERIELVNNARVKAIRDFVKQHKEIMREFLYSDSTDFMMKWCEYETSTDNLLTEMVGDKNA